jgi:hypothetical protein
LKTLCPEPIEIDRAAGQAGAGKVKRAPDQQRRQDQDEQA